MRHLFRSEPDNSSNLALRERGWGMIRIKIREFSLEIVKPKTWEIALVIVLWAAAVVICGYVAR
jgi:hypothetical protein